MDINNIVGPTSTAYQPMYRIVSLISALTGTLISPVVSHAQAQDPLSVTSGALASPVSAPIPAFGCPTELPRAALTLSVAVERALCHHPQTRQTWLAIQEQAAAVGVSKAAYLPTVNAGGNLARQRRESTLAPGLNIDSEGTAYSGSLDLNWLLFDFGARRADLDSARQLLAAAQADHHTMVQTIFIETVHAYYDALSAQATIEASRQAQRAARESFLAAEAKYKAEVGTLADKLQAETAYAQATLDKVKAEGVFQSAMGTLAINLGLPPITPLILDTRLEQPSASELPLGAEALIEEALQRHPKMASARAQVDAARANMDAVRAAGRPSVNLTGNYQNEEMRDADVMNDTSTRERNVGVQVRIPLFEGFGRHYRIQRAQTQTQIKAAEQKRTEQQVSLEVWKSYQLLHSETENITATVQLMRSAQQTFDVSLGRYKSGVGSIIELLTAQTALANATQQRAHALANWRVARLRLAASVGRVELS